MSVAAVRPAFALGVWHRHLAVLAAIAAVILLLFRRDVGDLVGIWWTSTTFGHCLFILPVVGWLVWSRRRELSELTPVAWWPALGIVAAGGAAWLVGDAAGVALARQIGLVTMLEGAVVTTLGPAVARGLLFPLAYAFFMVPFGDGIEPPLQDVTVSITLPLLHLVGVPASVDGVLIHAGRYYFEVAEACSGAKFVIAMVAYGALVANLCFTGWRRRAVWMAACVAVPVLANGVRAFGTIWAADLSSVEAATGMDHIVYGWVFFAAVMAGMMAAAWRWFDRSPDAPAFDPAALAARPRATMEVAVAGLLVAATAAIFPAIAHAAASRTAALPAHIALPAVPGWHRVAVSERAPWFPHYPNPDHHLFGRYADAGGDAVDVALATYATQREGKELVGFGIGPLREADPWVRIGNLPDVAGGRAMRIVAQARSGRGTVERVVVTWYRVGDTLTGSERQVKLATARMRLLGSPAPATAFHLSVEVTPGRDPAATLRRFLAALGPVDAAVDRITASRG